MEDGRVKHTYVDVIIYCSAKKVLRISNRMVRCIFLKYENEVRCIVVNRPYGYLISSPYEHSVRRILIAKRSLDGIAGTGLYKGNLE